MIRTRILGLLLLGLLAIPTTAWAAGKEFDFKDPKGINAVVVVMDSPLEPVAGIARDVSGTVQFDPANPRAATGKIIVAVRSLQFPQERYTETAHGLRGLDASNHPNVEFTLKSVQEVRRVGENVWEGTIVGDFTCHGVTRTITVPMKATYLPGQARVRNRGMAGDLLVLRTTFTIKRGDYGIGPMLPAATVAEEIEIRFGLVGTAPENGS